MVVRLLSSDGDLQRYDMWIKSHPQANLWQSLERKKYLEALGKEVRIYAIGEPEFQATALVMIDTASLGMKTWDVPRGPLFEKGFEASAFINELIQEAKNDNALAFYLSPFQPIATDYSPSSRHIHADATIILDLTKSEDELLAQMKQKGRYNIRLAEKHGVTVSESDDVEAFYKLVSATSNRDGFTALPKAKYKAFLEALEGSFLLMAHGPDKEPIAALIGVIWGNRAIYYYGASSYLHRALMAPYALQWEAMRLCKARGATTYDLLGVAPPDAPANHPWSGITKFKEQFGGTLAVYPPEQVVILKPIMHGLLKLKRKILG